MDLWDSDAIDLLGPAYIEINADGTGAIRFIAVEGTSTAASTNSKKAELSSSHGRAMTRGTQSQDAVGPTSRRTTAHCMGGSSSTWATTRASGQPDSGPLREPPGPRHFISAAAIGLTSTMTRELVDGCAGGSDLGESRRLRHEGWMVEPGRR